jgi:serine/threonine protein kinase
MPGTRFYCAPKEPRGKSVICPKVDVYSLGVIALELAYRFGTKTERNIELEGLKDGKFPSGFECHEMAEGIKNMLRKEREERWGCAQVRRWLERLIKKIEGEMPAKETVEMGETEDTKDDEKTSRQEIGNGEDMKKVEETKQADKV